MIRTRSITFALSLLVAGAGVASAQETQPRQRSDKGAMQGRHVRHGAARRLFRGVNLSDAQKDQVKAIHAKYASQYGALRETMKADAKQVGEARQRGDTAAARAAWQATAPEREQLRALMEREQAELRGMLTPEQQRTFDSNVASVRERMLERGGGRHGKGRRPA